MTTSFKGLFLDRDGVINVDEGYVYRPQDIRFIPGIFALCRAAQKKGYRIVIVTNQSGIARGYYSTAQFEHLSGWLAGQFQRQGVTISGILHCPHHPAVEGPLGRNCWCRKPRPGMLIEGARRYRLDRQRSIMIGDKVSDIQAARQAGIRRAILFREAPGKRFRRRSLADHTITRLCQAEKLL
ncbi:D-glycero-alpha-D-manno-heptose-1,7-bisphosphate 7-phosphatase [Mangrovitalea sediminis]|uniref:D-glycero-alpha-D-manno-heptose-1,7-bisphosphate 7-phosphatase n=1 Tax=Mangrovitalea sediminis TaxID=1982043 RepID=UPI00130457B0|nr:HAD family hydrolase [Mangrovitalea sediminis]